ncbi:hypothetical protein JCM11641_000683 [Rhodosporidiobolus odoratus]
MQGYPPHHDMYSGHYPLPHPTDPHASIAHHQQQQQQQQPHHQPPPQHHLPLPLPQLASGTKRKAAQAQLGEDDDDDRQGSEAGSAGQEGGPGAKSKGKGGASEFVKKLYRMLDDDQHHDIVSWGHDGTSFVVKDMNQFTTNILPNNFKHSNFASFVRQLNKYDFHKVKNNDGEGSSQYGENTWEFRHPNFRADMKDNLENIKRKAPSSKKTTNATTSANRMRATGMDANGAAVDPLAPAAVNTGDFNALAAQLDNLARTQAAMQQHMTNLSQDYQAVIGEMMNFQRNMVAQDQLMQNLIQYLVNLEADQKGPAPQDPSVPFVPSSQAQKLISSYTEVARASYDQMADLSRRASLSGGNFGNLPPLPPPPPNFGQFEFTPTRDDGQPPSGGYEPQHPGQGQPPPTPSQHHQPQPPQSQQQAQHSPVQPNQPHHPIGGPLPPAPLPQFVHPAFASAPPPNAAPAPAPAPSTPAPTERPSMPHRRQSNVPGWAVPPRVLLVEDDAVCRKLSSKFLEVFGCQIDVAVDGVSAVNKMNVQKYDLVLMDIVMPNLDGVSATSLIRKFDPTTPIISMTSNSGPNDIMTYFSHGMNDILPKPFTKENLLGMLEKHLDHLKLLQQMAEIPRALGFTDNQIQDALAHSVVVSTGTGGEQQVLNPFSSMGISDQDYVEMLQGIAMEKEGKRELEVVNPGDGRARFQEVQ